ncbi:MAG: ribulose-phosphate 3-epimerase [candidate division WOR-3 bacterium]
MKVAASILDCDFLHLQDELSALVDAGVDIVHLDIMDGHFVPNLSFGVPLARAVRGAVRLPVHAHLMVNEPEWLIEKFLPFSDVVIFHLEATDVPEQCLETIASAGRAVGVCLNPDTPIETASPWFHRLGEVLLMSVYPGFGGQRFMPATLERIRTLRRLLNSAGSAANVAVDGGISPANCQDVAAAGADIVVAGSAILKSRDYAAAVRALRCSAF